ncbi:MAG: hypothetical protein KBS96_02480 [Lachnospiraceae bacterium]|nr:hypothetical protein [Candidatus Colinaster scatohippi]
MLSILVVWGVIAAISYVIGKAVLILTGLSDKEKNIEWDICLVAGLGIANLYAQIFSLFAGVGMVAFLVLSLLAVAASVYLKKKNLLKPCIISHKNDIKNMTGVALIIILLATVLWTDITPQHYDTYLYHAQAIHWIERFGVVKGLGNLHFRLAYNSALMPLQALYSFAWLGGRSLHMVNGFFTAFVLVYAALNIGGSKEKIRISDILTLGMMIYVLYDSFHMSSPNTDTIALLLIYYIIVKWQRYSEDGIVQPEKYGLLCLFIVYATTIKLSVGIMVLLVIYPAVQLIKNRNITLIVKYLFSGILLLIPYLIRNVIISGYMIYPYEATAVRGIDWRMSEATLATDRAEIIAWARGNYNITRNDEHIRQWFGQWFMSINILWKLMFVISILAILCLLIICIRDRRKFSIIEYNLIGVCICGMAFWLITAPLPRYGTIYVITLPCIAAGMLVREYADKLMGGLKKVVSIGFIASLVLYLLLFPAYVCIKNVGQVPLFVQSDYDNHEVVTETLGDFEIVVPVSGDQTGYEPFPSAPYSDAASRIELRGATLEDGFREKNSN